MEAAAAREALRLTEEYDLVVVPVRVRADCTTDLENDRGEYLRAPSGATRPEALRPATAGLRVREVGGEGGDES